MNSNDYNIDISNSEEEVPQSENTTKAFDFQTVSDEEYFLK